MARKSYPTDLTDMEWEILSPLIPLAKEGGHPRTTDMRRLSKDYEHLPEMSEAAIYAVMTRIMLRRLVV